MGKFLYTAQDSQGSTTTGVLDAGDENEAAAALQSRGLLILQLQQEKSGAAAKGLKRFAGRVSGQDLVFFGAQLSTLLNGGIPLVRSLSLMAENSENKTLGSALQAITRDVASGSQFYQAMAKQSDVFDNLWVSLIQAGELSGQLPRSLKQIAEYMESQEEMKGKIMTALMYPAVLFVISAGTLAFFVIKIVPTFADIFKSFNLKLPLLTATIIGISTALATHLILIIVIATGGVLALRSYLATPIGAMTWARLQITLPFFGGFINNILLERLLTTLTTLLTSGVSILNAIQVLENVYATNPMFQDALKAVRNEVAQGKAISSSFARTGILPPIATQMMMMGEESGKLPEILATLANFYRSQVDSFIKRFTSIIDPIMVVFIGGLVAVIVLAVFQPIFELSQVGSGGGGG